MARWLVDLAGSRRQLRRLVRRERRSTNVPPLPTRLRLWRHGFLGESAAIYGVPANPPGAYLSDVARYVRTPRINGRRSAFLNDKLLFHAVLGAVAPLPHLFGVIVDGRYLPVGGDEGPPGDEAVVERLTRRHGALVVKPSGGGGGGDINIFELDGDVVTRNGRHAEPGELRASRFQGTYVVTAHVRQAAYARRIHPATTNTVRLLTMIDPDDGEPFSPIAVHRFGNRRSAPVDNWTQGGLSALVDDATGTLGPGVTYPRRGAVERHDHHPDTGAAIAGVVVPHWPAVRDGVLATARALSFVPYVGWDVIVTDDGFAIIEGNSFTDVNLLQVHRPLLTDERVRRFYRHHGVIGPRR